MTFLFLGLKVHFLGGWGSYNLTFGVGFFSFFNFRLGTYNVPEGPSANLYVEARRAEFDGTGVPDG